EPQLAPQALLEGVPEPLDAAFALRRAGLDVADAQVLEDAAEMGGRLNPSELLFEGPVPISADEDVDAIAVEGHGQADGGEDLVQQGRVAVEVFGRAEVQGDDRGRRILDGAQQRHRRAPPLEPGEGTAVGVTVLEQGLDSQGEGRGQAPGRGLAAALMAQGAGSARADALLQALKLSGSEVQGGGALSIADAARQGRADQTRAGHFLPAHRESLHRETTSSRSSYPTTFSCSSSSQARAP